MRLPSLLWKLYIGYAVLLLLTLVVVVVMVLRAMTHHAMEETRQRLHREAAPAPGSRSPSAALTHRSGIANACTDAWGHPPYALYGPAC